MTNPIFNEEQATQLEILQPINFNSDYSGTNQPEIQGKSLRFSPEMVVELGNTLKTAGLFVSNDMDDLLHEIISGLMQGNIIIQGPPGTGKTTFVESLCQVFQVSYQLVTALPQWSTYDTIGGLQPSTNEEGGERFISSNGCVTEAVLECCNYNREHIIHQGETKKPEGHWLIIDELNRGELDKMFGTLFTTFGSQQQMLRKIHLPFHQNEKLKTIFVPDNFRLIGLMNDSDRNFIFEMSHAMARRFTIITLEIPTYGNFPEEFKACFHKSQERVASRIGKTGDKIFEDYTSALLTSPNISELQDFLKLLRYKEMTVDDLEGDDGLINQVGLGLQFGTALLLDCLEFFIYRFVLHNYFLDSDEKEVLFFQTADSAITTQIIAQARDVNTESLEQILTRPVVDSFPKSQERLQQLLQW